MSCQDWLYSKLTMSFVSEHRVKTKSGLIISINEDSVCAIVLQLVQGLVKGPAPFSVRIILKRKSLPCSLLLDVCKAFVPFAQRPLFVSGHIQLYNSSHTKVTTMVFF